MSEKPKIVVFLQNQWFKNPERIKWMIAEHRSHDTAEEAREFYLRTFLFWGCLTGKRLQAAFGDALCDEIIWEEQSPEIGGHSSSSFPPNIEHICGVLRRHQPTHVVALGKLATTALARLRFASSEHRWDLIVGPHPAARHATVVQELKDIGDQLKLLEAT